MDATLCIRNRVAYLSCAQERLLQRQVFLADVLRMTVWQTPAGIVDEGGMVLQAWLNFGITLVAPPANGLMHVRI